LQQDVVTWKNSFEDLMKSEIGRQAFTAFVRQSLADEYFLFWQAVEAMKKEIEPIKYRSMVTDIFTTFITPGAPLEIVFEAKNCEAIATKMGLEYLDPDMFCDVQAHAYAVMQRDQYPAFLKSETYADIVRRSIP
jgi:ABC-type sulfate transport system substrate-binding protein